MKVAYVHSGRWPSNSPSMTFSSLTAHSLASEVEACYFYIQKNSELSPEKIYSDYFELDVPQSLHVQPISRGSLFNTNRFFYWKVIARLKKLIKSGQLDVVFTRSLTFLPYLARLKKKYDVAVFYESHDFFADLAIRDDVGPKKKRQQKLELQYLPQIDGIICLQNTQIEQYQKVFPNVSCHLARTGISKLLPQNNSEKKKCLGYVGSLDKHKGVEMIVRAASLSKTQPEVLIIGGKTEKEIANFQARVNSAYNNISITGWLKKAELERKLSEVKVGIMTLQNTFFNRHLISPLKLFDFYSAGIPVIASNLPAIQELLADGGTGFLVDGDDAQAIAEKIDLLWNDEHIYEKQRTNVQKEAASLLWAERAKSLTAYFSKFTDA